MRKILSGGQGHGPFRTIAPKMLSGFEKSGVVFDFLARFLME
jgi:hypothetical protein